jgi:DNA-binding NtrC family response regulator
MTGNPSVTSSIEALRAGAWDYLPKPFSATHLQVLIGRASHAVMVARETRDLGQQLSKQSGNSDKITLIGISPRSARRSSWPERSRATDASVFIMGESGTGKEVIAQFIHQHIPARASDPGADQLRRAPEGLLESEMFGHRKGAFTGADRDKPGLLETANGGTLFLDELTEMSLPLQAKLLRVIQDGVVRRVGSEKEDAVVDVRFLSATNRDPQECVAKGTLRGRPVLPPARRADHLPPPPQAAGGHPAPGQPLPHALLAAASQNGRPRSRVLSESAIEFLRSRPWRGNVRELQNVIEHDGGAHGVGSPRPAGRCADLRRIGTEYRRRVGFAAQRDERAFHVAKDKLIAHFEKEYLGQLIARAGSNMSKAARLANIDRTTLYRLMEKHGFRRDDLSGSAE